MRDNNPKNKKMKKNQKNNEWIKSLSNEIITINDSNKIKELEYFTNLYKTSSIDDTEYIKNLFSILTK
jgi:hypothetical protein